MPRPANQAKGSDESAQASQVPLAGDDVGLTQRHGYICPGGGTANG